MLTLLRVALPNMVYFACDGGEMWGPNNVIEQIYDGVWEIALRPVEEENA